MKKNKIISLVLVCLIVFSNITFACAVESNEYETSLRTVNWYKLAWKILKSVGGNYTWDTKTPTYSTGDNMDHCSSGSHLFNEGENQGKVKHDVSVRNISNDELTSFVENSNPLTWTRKALISYYDSNGREIGNKSVTHEQFYSINPSGSGTFRVEFSTAQEHKWNCHIEYWHYDDYNGVSRTASINDVNFYKTSNKIYKIPSESHNNSMVQSKKNANYLSMNMLLNQLYDAKLHTFVSDFKDYNIGDEIIFEDTIKNIYYDHNIYATIFVFDTNNEQVEWPFAGDLMNRYSVGQKLSLKFKIVEEYSDDNITIEKLDYIMDGLENIENNLYPNIENYLY